jgi:Fe-S cluster biogenesis protein NfuA
MINNFYYSNPISYEIMSENNPKFINEIFSINFIDRVFINRNFISITKYETASWKVFYDNLMSVLSRVSDEINTYDIYNSYSSHNSIGDVIYNNDIANNIHGIQFEATYENLFEENSIEWKIQQVLNQEIRPAVNQDGGDIILVDFIAETGLVRVKMMGACIGCPYSMHTLSSGIETALKNNIPEVQSVISI